MPTATKVPFRSQPECAAIYAANVTALNPQITIIGPSGEEIASDWWVKSESVGGLASGQSQDLYVFQRNQFAQTASGSSLDDLAANLALPPRYSNFYATGQGVINTAPVSTVVIPYNSELVDSTTGSKYLTMQTITITSSTPLTVIPFRANTIGSGLSLPPGTQLTLSTPIVGIDSIQVDFISDGFLVESDSALASRIIARLQNPPGGGSLGDFKRWAMYYQAFVTDAYVFRFVLDSVRIIYSGVMQGTFQPDAILANPSVPYSRSAITSVVDMTYAYVETVRPANVVEVVNTVATFLVPDNLTVQVVLIPGHTLTTFISSVGLTVQDLISREIRRAIISTPAGGTIQFNPSTMQNENFILISDIEQTLDIGLSATNTETGTYASILMNRRVSYPDPTGQIPVPFGNAILDSFKNSQVIYDIDYSSIIITENSI